MIWLWAYLGCGVIALIVILVSHFRHRPAKTTSDLLDSLKGPMSTKDKVLEKVVVPLLASVLAVVAWPIAVRYVIKERQNEKREVRRREDAIFRVRAVDLLHRTTQSEIEATALIVDPLGAAPDLPFGHLHGVWQTFLDQRPVNAELWTFACEWENDWGHVSLREGYVWVLGDKQTPWMLTRDVSKDSDVE